MFGANPATAEQFATSSNISNSVRTLVSISVYLCALLSAQGIMVDRGEMWRKTMKGRNTVSFSILIKDITPRFRPYNEGDLFPGFLGCKWPDTCQYVSIYIYDMCIIYISINETGEVSKAAFLQRANHPEALPFSIHHQLWSQIQPTLSLAQWIRLLNLPRLSKSSQNQHTNRRLSRTKS